MFSNIYLLLLVSILGVPWKTLCIKCTLCHRYIRLKVVWYILYIYIHIYLYIYIIVYIPNDTLYHAKICQKSYTINLLLLSSGMRYIDQKYDICYYVILIAHSLNKHVNYDIVIWCWPLNMHSYACISYYVLNLAKWNWGPSRRVLNTVSVPLVCKLCCCAI